ncbi:hypothetical protein L6452_34072 [Arctium lappa]|uniref:Uncharacterized protein n=1 Tax=Arctium lappa TaxID=4217 RepID=A0ACB8YH80_ARCLA|nr:hypothetical protein L6452_34072 [Arctium lappa]
MFSRHHDPRKLGLACTFVYAVILTQQKKPLASPSSHQSPFLSDREWPTKPTSFILIITLRSPEMGKDLTVLFRFHHSGFCRNPGRIRLELYLGRFIQVPFQLLPIARVS